MYDFGVGWGMGFLNYSFCLFVICDFPESILYCIYNLKIIRKPQMKNMKLK